MCNAGRHVSSPSVLKVDIVRADGKPIRGRRSVCALHLAQDGVANVHVIHRTKHEVRLVFLVLNEVLPLSGRYGGVSFRLRARLKFRVPDGAKTCSALSEPFVTEGPDRPCPLVEGTLPPACKRKRVDLASGPLRVTTREQVMYQFSARELREMAEEKEREERRDSRGSLGLVLGVDGYA